jgi:hypothetical protein
LFSYFVFKIQMPSDVRVKLINDLADIEYVLYNFFKLNHGVLCIN